MSTIRIIGILNVTPDSFYDGGKFFDIAKAVAQAKKMRKEGADFVEVGGQSALNAPDVGTEGELKRVIPVIQAIKKADPSCPISIDTCRAEVAREAVNAGASMINDVTAGRFDPLMFKTCADAQVPLVLMYSKDIGPSTAIADADYADVMATVIAVLRRQKEAAIKAGVSSDRIILDPGLGYFISTDPKYSFEIIARLPELASLGSPILLSPSRKSFLAGPEKLPAADRLPATLAASAIAVMHGASYIRTHDVLETRQTCDIASHIKLQSKNHKQINQ